MKLRHLVFPLALLVVSCATTPRVRTDYLPQEDFSRYHTFAVHPEMSKASTVNPEIGPTLVARVKQAAITGMQAREFDHVDPTTADLLVVVHGHLEDKIDVRPYGYVVPHYHYHRSGHDRGYAYGYGYDLGYRAYDYRQGTLIVDLIDRTKRELVWRGWSRHQLSSHRPLDGEKVATQVIHILQSFPPGRETENK